MSKSILSRGIKVKPLIMAATAAGLAVTGALYGAGLKEKQEIKKISKSRGEATPAEKMAILELTKSGLMSKKADLESKLADIEARNKSGRPTREACLLDRGDNAGI